MKRFALAILLILLMTSWGWATTYTASSESEWDTAYASASSGDTIQITGSWSATKQYDVAKQLTIEGVSNPTITINSDIVSLFKLHATGITIKNFTIDGNKSSFSSPTNELIPIEVSATNCIINGMSIENSWSYCIRVNTSQSGISIQKCTFSSWGHVNNPSYDGDAIRFNSSATDCVVESCTFLGDMSLSGTSGSWCGVFINGASDIVITRCTFSNIPRVGVKIYTGSSSVTVSGCTFITWGLAASSDAINIAGANSLVSGNTMIMDRSTSNNIYALEISGGLDAANGSIIQNNTISGTYLQRGISGGGSTITFRHNKITATDYGVYLQNCSGSKILYNLFTINGDSGETAIYLDSNATGSRTIEVYNNNVIDVGNTEDGIHFVETSGTWSSIDLRNNIIQGFNRGVVVDDKDDDGISITHINNDYYENTSNLQKLVGSAYSDISLDSSEITDSPLLAPDYHLLPNSPCIDAGEKLSIHDSGWKDLRGNSQRYGTAPDIGCYEAVTDIGSPWRRHGWNMASWGIGDWKKNRWAAYSAPIGGTITDEGDNNVLDENSQTIDSES